MSYRKTERTQLREISLGLAYEYSTSCHYPKKGKEKVYQLYSNNIHQLYNSCSIILSDISDFSSQRSLSVEQLRDSLCTIFFPTVLFLSVTFFLN